MELQKIMMVDDDDGIRRIAQLTLTKLGKFEIVLARSGKEALALVQEHNPDLILLDVMMPEMDGPAVLKELRSNEKTATIPVVFMTAKIQRHEVQAYSQMGASGVISKPFEPSELPGQLRELYRLAVTA